MSTEPKPMNPERLASLRRFLVARARCMGSREMATELLGLVGAHDYWRAQAEKFEGFFGAASRAGFDRTAEWKAALGERDTMRARTERAERERDEEGKRGARALMTAVVEIHERQREVCVMVAAACSDLPVLSPEQKTPESVARFRGWTCYPEPQPEDAPKDDYTIVTPLGAAVRAARPTPDPIDTPGVHHGDTSAGRHRRGKHTVTPGMHSLSTPCCDAPILSREVATWYQDEQERCPDCGDLATVEVSEDFGDDEPLQAALSMAGEPGGER